MKKELLLASAALLLTLSACDRPRETPKTTTRNTNETTRTTTRTDTSAYDADNTGRNVRDRDSRAVTPESQLENENDLIITQNIRRIVMDDDSLSTNAKNIKIITIKGVVTLRGVVNSEQEKAAIARKASSVRGIKNVVNQIEVKQNARDNANENDVDNNTSNSRY